VGRAGIRRRKPEHHLPKVTDDIPEGDLMRAFGNFRWSAYTPAGSLERSGFFLRRLSRRRRHPQWREYNRGIVLAGHVLITVCYGAVALAVLFALVDRWLGG
jgi:hypothetical protein